MDKILLKFNKENPVRKKEPVEIRVENNTQNSLDYKFMIGYQGVWTVLKDFSEEERCNWIPEEEGNYIFMVQGKEKGSVKPFDYMCKGELNVGESVDKLIKNTYVSTCELTVGEKLIIESEASKAPVLFRYWRNGSMGWELIRDYGTNNKLVFTATESGSQEILVECKEPFSENSFDDFYSVKYKVIDRGNVEIVNFKCLTEDLLCGEDLVFQVEAESPENSMVLFKFVKVDNEGKAVCLQDYSSKTLVSFSELKAGEYKILCMAKDMYSNKEFDDRALMVYNVKPYNPIVIKGFTTDLASPQVTGTSVLLRAFAEGGKELLYRFKVDGNYGEDTGFIRNSTYIWDTKFEGDYIITLYVKDASYGGEYESKKEMEFCIDKKSTSTVKIKDIILNKEGNYLVNDTINIKVIAEGGTVLKYSFVIYKDKIEIEKVNYGDNNWVNFTPGTAGEYEFEIKVKDKYSQKEYDGHSIIFFDVMDYLPGRIDQILLPSKEYHLVGEEIELETIIQNTEETLVNYVIKINGQLAEETGFIKNKKLKFNPKIPGKYTFEIYAKNIKCTKAFDSKKDFNIYVNEAPPVIGTKIIADRKDFIAKEEIIFNVECQGGKEVCYEFYIMSKGNWIRKQAYGRKSYLGFMPFSSGNYKILVLTKSYYKRIAYEDYAIMEFTVTE
ncbi:MAG: triple tyrosine motif-containing protein [Clostridiaceae bacterium]